jgi:hypothetical protein
MPFHRRQRLPRSAPDVKSRIIGVGPQIGYNFRVGTMQGYLNLKAYKEFDNNNRLAGYNAWLTFAICSATN